MGRRMRARAGAPCGGQTSTPLERWYPLEDPGLRKTLDRRALLLSTALASVAVFVPAAGQAVNGV